MRLTREIRQVNTDYGELRLVVLRPKDAGGKVPGILWLHGGGFFEGSADMVLLSRARDAAREFGAVVVSPDYRLSTEAPYPAALEDCYAALEWLNENRDELGVSRIIVGGESAGGGLTAALSMLARDRGEIAIDYQLPLYPMLDCFDTDSSRDNKSIFWNTKKNHEAWKLYLGSLWGSEDIPAYASPARRADLSGLPPCYTFVCDGEPFYRETLDYVERLNAAGVTAKADVYHADAHAFDMVFPWRQISKDAKARFLENFGKMINDEF